MAFWNKILKRKYKKEQLKGEKKIVAAEKEVEILPVKTPVGEKRVLVGVIRRPHITEKTSGSVKDNKYAFIAESGQNKHSIRRAVETRYGVAVTSVNIVNMPGKERKRGRQIGWRPGFKKAVVTLKEGQSIEIQ